METTVSTVRNYFRKKQSVAGAVIEASVPQIGFKVSFCESDKQLRIKVIGARQLPVECGSIKPKGYLVKVTLYPQKDKFETKTVASNWPTINEEFSCNMQYNPKKTDDYLKGKFISFTVYAVLFKDEEEKPVGKTKSVLKRYLSFNDTEDELLRDKRGFGRSGSIRRSSYTTTTHSMSSRRTVGAVTYNLEKKAFTQKLRDDVISTPEIWRNVLEISSGIQTQSRDGTKGSLELTLQYGLSEDRTNDVVEVTVTKFRCSIQTMQEHQRVGGRLYIKITAFGYEDIIQNMKSDQFDPTISLKLDPTSSTLRATVNTKTADQMKILIRLISKNLLGKKELLGKVEIDSKSEFWKEILAKPSEPVTKMVNLV